MKLKKRYYLQKKKLKELKKDLGDYSTLINSKSKIEIQESEPYDIILIDGEPLVMKFGKQYFPTLKGALKLDINKKYVVVDMGAVKFVAKGADIMSPGIIQADPEVMEGDFVIIIDETHKKPLAIGKALISGPEMVENSQGKAIKTIHYIGDKIWNLNI